MMIGKVDFFNPFFFTLWTQFFQGNFHDVICAWLDTVRNFLVLYVYWCLYHTSYVITIADQFTSGELLYANLVCMLQHVNTIMDVLQSAYSAMHSIETVFWKFNMVYCMFSTKGISTWVDFILLVYYTCVGYNSNFWFAASYICWCQTNLHCNKKAEFKCYESNIYTEI